MNAPTSMTDTADNSFVVEVTPENFQQAVIDQSAHTPVLLDFWADWCGPCKSLTPVLESLAAEYAGGFILAKVNADEQQQIAAQLGVRSLPTVKLIVEQQIVDEFVGAQPETEVRAFLDKHITPAADAAIAPAPGSDAVMQADQLLQQGQAEQALSVLQQAVNDDSTNTLLVARLAEMHASLSDFDQAEAVLKNIDEDQRNHTDILRATAIVAFAQTATQADNPETLGQAIEDGSATSEQRYLFAANLILAGQTEAAMELLLDLVMRDRKYGEDAARKGLIMAFDMLGREHPLVGEYRRKLSIALN